MTPLLGVRRSQVQIRSGRALRRCACRKPHPASSGGVLVLVEGAAERSCRRMVPTQRSMIAFIRGVRSPDRTTWMPTSFRMVSKRSMTRFLTAWVIQAAVGCSVVPRIRMRRLASSMTAKMWSLVPVRVMVSRQSHAKRASAWERRMFAQVVAPRSGAGSVPASRRISQTVEGATSMPGTSSSPWMRR